MPFLNWLLHVHNGLARQLQQSTTRFQFNQLGTVGSYATDRASNNGNDGQDHEDEEGEDNKKGGDSVEGDGMDHMEEGWDNKKGEDDDSSIT